MLSVNTNMGALIAANQLNNLNNDYNKIQEQATTGKRINSAADDAAGLAIVMGMEQERRGNDMALNNISRGKDLLSTQEKAMGAVDEMFGRLKELAVGAADGTMSATDRAKNNAEAQDIMQEIDRISQSTEYNGVKLQDGSVASVDLQIGAGTGAEDSLTVNLYDGQLASMNITGGDLTSAANAQTFLDNLALDSDALATGLATIGAVNNRLDFASNNLKSMNESLASSMSSIEDADMAKVAAELKKNEVLQQMSYSMLGKANAQPGNYLSLFR